VCTRLQVTPPWRPGAEREEREKLDEGPLPLPRCPAPALYTEQEEPVTSQYKEGRHVVRLLMIRRASRLLW